MMIVGNRIDGSGSSYAFSHGYLHGTDQWRTAGRAARTKMGMLKALLVTPRPSKQFFYHLLFRDAKKISRDDWVLDFATQGGKNYSLLSKGRYVGADINPG